MQNRVVGAVAKVYVVQDNVASKGGIAQCAIVMRVLPGPHIGALGVLYQLALLVFADIDQCYIAFVLLGCLIEKVKDTCYRGGKVFGKRQEGHGNVNGQCCSRDGWRG